MPGTTRSADFNLLYRRIYSAGYRTIERVGLSARLPTQVGDTAE
jgi:hypothetical protein